MNIKQPTKINSTAVDATTQPIVLANNIGGYLSSAPNKAGGMMGGGGMPSGAMPSGMTPPSARGRDNVTDAGVYFGKAPAAIVDPKAAVRYLKANATTIPGNTERIVSTGSSAGGALSVLLGASGGSDLYKEELTAIGAAHTSGTIYAAAGYCPITDLEHADPAYEWCFGTSHNDSLTIDTSVSHDLAAQFPDYFNSLKLKNNQGTELTTDNLAEHILSTHIRPAARRYLYRLSEEEKQTYLTENAWVDGEFTWEDYISHLTRKKNAPAFDLSSGENILFGNQNTNARHFTEYSQGGAVEQEVQKAVTQLNPMPFIMNRNPDRAKQWFLRVGTKDTDTSFSVVSNLDSAISSIGDKVDTAFYWDQGHGANDDPDAFVQWVKSMA